MIRIGTRKSELALWQANQVKDQLDALGANTILVPLESEGDQNLIDPLYKMGIQGVFTKTLDAALLNNKIDLAVHSLKDVPTVMAQGIEISAVLPRGASKDVIVKHPDRNKSETEKQIGTGSLRRKAQWLRKYPNYTVENLRGNVQKRLEKLSLSVWEGAIFAQAGLERLGLLELTFESLEWMISAPAQGIVGIASLETNSALKPYLNEINCEQTALCAKIERTFLNTLEGGCTAPIGAFSEIKNDRVYFNGGLFTLDGSQAITVEESISLKDASGFGIQLAQKILSQGGKTLMKEIKSKM